MGKKNKWVFEQTHLQALLSASPRFLFQAVSGLRDMLWKRCYLPVPVFTADNISAALLHYLTRLFTAAAQTLDFVSLGVSDEKKSISYLTKTDFDLLTWYLMAEIHFFLRCLKFPDHILSN